MPNNFERGINALRWTAKKHFENPITALTERKPFAARVTEYVDLLREAFPPAKEGDDSIIPFERNAVVFADIPILTQFIQDLSLEMPPGIPRSKFSLAVIARRDEDTYTMGVGAMDNGIYRAGFLLDQNKGAIKVGIETTENNSGAFFRAGSGMNEMFDGLTGHQRELQMADKVFKFIVSRTLEQVQDRFS